jgi:lysophospholipase L1-like esterase
VAVCAVTVFSAGARAAAPRTSAFSESGSSQLLSDSTTPLLSFLSPSAQLAAAPRTASLAVPAFGGTFQVPYIQTSPNLDVTVAVRGPADRSIVDVILDAGTPAQQLVRRMTPPWTATFSGLSYGEHTLTARLYVPEPGIPLAVALDAPPLAQAYLDHVARGDIVAALGDSTTEGLGEGPWQGADQQLLAGAYPDWTAASARLAGTHPDWITADSRTFPQNGPNVGPRPSFIAELARTLTAQTGHPVLVINDGWSGTTADAYLHISTSTVFADQMNRTKPDAWVMNLGVNDALVKRSPADYIARLQGIVTNLETQFGATPDQVHVACPSYAKQPERNALESQYLGPIDQLRAQDKLGAAPNFFSAFRDNQGLIADEVHPNFAGYAAMGQLWAAAIQGHGQGCG